MRLSLARSSSSASFALAMTAMGRASRLGKVAVGLLLLTLCVVGAFWYVSQRPQRDRMHWKNDAIPAIARWAEAQNWRTQEIEVLTKRTNDQRVIAEGWLTDQMILMQSGEWLAYKSHCSKRPPHSVRDIFLAKGSDGKWYYSTFHFCVGMCALVMVQETQPATLAEFAHEYNLREFDGRSDECLKETATLPASWNRNSKTNSVGTR